MSDNRLLNENIEISDYNSLVASINYEYCQKHNYDFQYYRPYYLNKDNYEIHNCIDPNTNQKRHASWSKLLTTQKVLELNYDYVVYIDSDCIFKNFDIKIESYIENNLNVNMFFLHNKPFSLDNRPCAGFYICKTCDETKKTIKNWYDYNLPSRNYYRDWEQSVLHLIYQNIPGLQIINEYMFIDKENQFLRHIHGSSYESCNERIPYFKKYIIDKNIKYKDSIKMIQCISYNTSNIEIFNTITKLCMIADEYNLDKGSINNKVRHTYTKVYYELLKNIRNNNLRIFELGIGTKDKNIKNNMNFTNNYNSGNSLRMWKKFLPNSLIYGADIDKTILFEEDRIQTYYCNVLELDTIKSMWQNKELIENFDLIIDDGLHELNANINLFENSYFKLKKSGIYIIEDIIYDKIQLYENQKKIWIDKYPMFEYNIYILPHFNKYDNVIMIIKYKNEIQIN